MTVQTIDLQVDGVPSATKRLSEAYGWQVLSDDVNVGELDAGGLRVMFSRDAMVRWGDLDGVVLHHDVEDVARAVVRAIAAGAELLDCPVTTGGGAEAAYSKGPGQHIVDVCREA